MGTDQHSKLAWYPEYEAEFDINKQIFEKIIPIHLIYLGVADETNSENFTSFYSLHRIEDVIVSVTDDLIRYAQYHKIKKKLHKDNYIFSIAEPVRAAFFTKWILKLRPSLADSRLSKKYFPSDEISLTGKNKPVNSNYHKMSFCNEYLALMITAQIFNIKKDGAILGFDTLFGFGTMDSLSTLFYSLRYRVVHQDSYNELYRSVFYKFKDYPKP